MSAAADVAEDPSLEAWKGLVDFDRLTAWMDAKGLEKGPIEEAGRPPGGTQNVLVKFRRGDRWFMLRRPPRHPRMNGSETMRREARLLAGIANSDVPHPRLIAACPEEDVLGAARTHLRPDALRILIVGNPEDFDEPLSALGEVKELDVTIPSPPPPPER